MARTDATAVDAILGANWDGTTDVAPFIAAATALIDRVAACAVSKGQPLTTAELELLERWMAAHFYTKMDPTYQSRSTGGASGSFVRDPVVPEPYKDGALSLDPTGCLASLLKGQRASMVWLGKTPTEALDFTERD